MQLLNKEGIKTFVNHEMNSKVLLLYNDNDLAKAKVLLKQSYLNYE